MTGYESTKAFSEQKLQDLRAGITGTPENVVVLTCGSYARREASDESDIDYFTVARDPGSLDQEEPDRIFPWLRALEKMVAGIVPIDPASGGAFATVENLNAMLQNIGGGQDDNSKITRRILFLLEGEWLVDEGGFQKIRRDVLERYIRVGIKDHHLAYFLLNDVIRFYRTMAVDYEYKITEVDKPWAIRNIKLVFSRKLLYASGLFSIALTTDRSREKKISLLMDLFNLPVIDRMIEICGKPRMLNVLKCYNNFLDSISSKDLRDHLKNLAPHDRSDPQFRELKNEGHNFNRELMRLFESTFDSTHPIRRAVVF
jgi:hypothetical protein